MVNTAIDFRYLEHDRLYAFTPTNRPARMWADANPAFDGFCRMGAAYGIPKDQYADIVDMIDAAGFHFVKGA